MPRLLFELLSRGSVDKGHLIRPAKRIFHALDTSTPGYDVERIFVFFSMENRDLFLVNLLDRSMSLDDLSCCVVGQDLLGGSGHGGIPVAG